MIRNLTRGFRYAWRNTRKRDRWQVILVAIVHLCMMPALLLLPSYREQLKQEEV